MLNHYLYFGLYLIIIRLICGLLSTFRKIIHTMELLITSNMMHEDIDSFY